MRVISDIFELSTWTANSLPFAAEITLIETILHAVPASMLHLAPHNYSYNFRIAGYTNSCRKSVVEKLQKVFILLQHHSPELIPLNLCDLYPICIWVLIMSSHGLCSVLTAPSLKCTRFFATSKQKPWYFYLVVSTNQNATSHAYLTNKSDTGFLALTVAYKRKWRDIIYNWLAFISTIECPFLRLIEMDNNNTGLAEFIACMVVSWMR